MTDFGKMVEVPGLGSFPHKISMSSDHFNINPTKRANGHNEKMVVYRCENNRGLRDILFDSNTDFISDDFDIDGIATGGGYKLIVHVDSESRNPLWNDGTIEFLYNSATRHWTMKGVVDGRGWKFCRPAAAFNLVMAGIHCMLEVSDDEYGNAYSNFVRLIAKSIEEDKGNIVQNAALYKKEEDCTMVPPEPTPISEAAPYIDY